MKEKIIKKQPNSKKCFVCGLQNEFGLNAKFYELENEVLVGIFQPDHNHQGYPGRLHGGLAATILDETLGRAITIKEKDIWGVTIDLSFKFRKPVPIDEEVKVIARITTNQSRMYEGTAEIRLQNGEIAVSATGKYMKLPLEKITDPTKLSEHWLVSNSDNDPSEIEIF